MPSADADRGASGAFQADGQQSSARNRHRFGRRRKTHGPKAARHGRRRADRLTIVLAVLLCVGVSLAAYPYVANWWNSRDMGSASADYEASVSQMESDADGSDDDQVQAMWEAADAYNADLLSQSDRFFPNDEQKRTYLGLLDPAGTGVMGQVVIPKLGIDLPIYHSTDNDVLSSGIGHIPGTSLPVGGDSTHCVLSGHRGRPDAELFTNIDQLVEGDTFELHVLGRTLTYQVDQIRIVLPNEVRELSIEPGEDLCTLVTCTPYGINTHRLLVRGHRVANASSLGAIMAEATQVDPLAEGAVLFCVVAAAAWGIYLVREHGTVSRKRELAKARKAWGLSPQKVLYGPRARRGSRAAADLAVHVPGRQPGSADGSRAI